MDGTEPDPALADVVEKPGSGRLGVSRPGGQHASRHRERVTLILIPLLPEEASLGPGEQGLDFALFPG